MSLVFLILGLLAAAWGGDRFVRGAVGLAAWLRVPPGIIGATVAAFATSSPELTVGVLAAADGLPELAFGDATGSNLVNLCVVLGVALLFGQVVVQWREVRRETVGFVAALVLLALCCLDGRIVRGEAVALLVVFVGWLAWVVRDARRDRSDVGVIGATRRSVIVVDVVVGLVLLIAAGRLIVLGAKDIGAWLGWSQFVVGSVVVAVGTSAPELVTTVVALRRGHVEVGVGTVLGSNIFNSLFIVGSAGVIGSIPVDGSTASVTLVAAVVAVLVVVPGRTGRLGRRRGVALLVLYAAALTVLVGSPVA